jgi:hypothetical protein
MTKLVMSMFATKADLLAAKADDAEAKAGKRLADVNEYREAGRMVKAEQCYAKAQYWLDLANKYRGKA